MTHYVLKSVLRCGKLPISVDGSYFSSFGYLSVSIFFSTVCVVEIKKSHYGNTRLNIYYEHYLRLTESSLDQGVDRLKCGVNTTKALSRLFSLDNIFISVLNSRNNY